ncbi:squalene/phytoene synthase family protein [Elioraea sp.]|uniref:phytoene/squalene synthase family protein n=1 Tax=Elioraea sp. TaxID=2185103 RepID=UPI0021DE0E8D|nr:MAG: phytoene synthase [Elioraea sp.]
MSPPLSPCGAIVRRDDPDRFLCALFAPEAAREALFTLYAFNAALAGVRDAVTEPTLGLIRLQWWRETVAEASHGRFRRHEVADPLGRLIAQKGFDPALFDAVITAREAEFAEEGIPDPPALEAYAAGTAGGLMRLALAVLGAETPAALSAARYAGTVYGLAGILRAAPVAAARGRTLLPRALLRREGTRLADLARRPAGEGVRRVVRAIVELADSHAATLRGLLPEVPRAALPALLPAALGVRTLGRLRGAGFDPGDARVAGPRLGAQWAVARMAWTGRV